MNKKLLIELKRITYAVVAGYLIMPLLVLCSIPLLWILNSEGTFIEITKGGFSLIKELLTFNAWGIFRQDIFVCLILAIPFYFVAREIFVEVNEMKKAVRRT